MPSKKLTSYLKVVNYLLSTYATTYIISKPNIEFINFKVLLHLSAVEYLQELWGEFFFVTLWITNTEYLNLKLIEGVS